MKVLNLLITIQFKLVDYDPNEIISYKYYDNNKISKLVDIIFKATNIKKNKKRYRVLRTLIR